MATKTCLNYLKSSNTDKSSTFWQPLVYDAKAVDTMTVTRLKLSSAVTAVREEEGRPAGEILVVEPGNGAVEQRKAMPATCPAAAAAACPWDETLAERASCRARVQESAVSGTNQRPPAEETRCRPRPKVSCRSPLQKPNQIPGSVQGAIQDYVPPCFMKRKSKVVFQNIF